MYYRTQLSQAGAWGSELRHSCLWVSDVSPEPSSQSPLTLGLSLMHPRLSTMQQDGLEFMVLLSSPPKC